MCKSTQCIYEGFMQEGRPDCTDASDENLSYLLTFSTVSITNDTVLSPMMICGIHFYTCNRGLCIAWHLYGD